MKTAVLFLVGFVGWILLSASPAVGGPGPTVEVIPSSQVLEIGEPLTVDVVISGLGAFAPPALGAFDLTLYFNPVILGFVDVSFGPFLGDEVAGEAITGFNFLGDELMAFEVSLLLPAELVALQPESFTLYTVTFDAVGPGTTPLDIVPPPLLSDEFGIPLTADVINGTVTVEEDAAVVEIPTLSGWGLIFLTLGLLAAGVVRLRRTEKVIGV